MPHQRLWPGALVLTIALAATWPGPVSGQPMTRSATTLAAIQHYPAFYHDKAITLAGLPVETASGSLTALPIEAPRQFIVVPQTGRVPLRPLIMRGRVFDIGRFASDDSRLGPLDLRRIITAAVGDRWPAREQLFILTGTSWTDDEARPGATMRNLALNPDRFVGQTVTMRGRFRGRNLLGDLPAWPRRSQWDFVLQTADAAVWVVGKRPRGDGFDLSTTTRAHTGRWLEVTGRVELVDDLPVIVAERLRSADAEADADPLDDETPLPLPPPIVIFSAPAEGEIEIARDVVVRIQFSRPVSASTLTPNIRVRYVEGVGTPMPDWSVTYRPGPMAAEIRFSAPLAADAGVIVELGEGVRAPDGVGLTPATLRFKTGARMRASGTQSPPEHRQSVRPGR